jgi:hypothetical protein
LSIVRRVAYLLDHSQHATDATGVH